MLRGVSTIIALDRVDTRLAVAHQLGADVTLNFEQVDVVTEVMRPTAVAAWIPRSRRWACSPLSRAPCGYSSPAAPCPAWRFSSDLQIPLDAFNAGLGDKKMVSSLRPGGKEHMRRLMNIVESQRVELAPRVTYHYALHDTDAAYELFANQRDGALKVAQGGSSRRRYSRPSRSRKPSR